MFSSPELYLEQDGLVYQFVGFVQYTSVYKFYAVPFCRAVGFVNVSAHMSGWFYFDNAFQQVLVAGVLFVYVRVADAVRRTVG